jgi:hypothetical protein
MTVAGPLPLHPAQVSVTYPGYPAQDPWTKATPRTGFAGTGTRHISTDCCPWGRKNAASSGRCTPSFSASR